MRIKRKKSEKTKNAKTNKYEEMPNKKVNRQTSFFCFATVLSTCLCERLWTEKTKGKGKHMC